MGLDWLPGRKAKPGLEPEMKALIKALDGWWPFGKQKKLARLEQITVHPHETLGAPIVGKDEQANEWARENFEKRTNKALDLPGFLQAINGLPVMQLVRPSDGLPPFSNGGPGEYVGEESFRAQFLKDCEDILGEGGYDECFLERGPEECERFGASLRAKATAYAQEHGIELSATESVEDYESKEFRVGVVMAAGRWCEYWGRNGHGMSPWF